MASSISRTNDNWEDKSPTDDELGKVLGIIPVWFQLAVDLGVPITQAEAYEKKPSHIGGLYALRYWRDGRCNETKFPPTWRFLLETAGTVCGSQVAKKLEAIVSPVQAQLVGPHGGGTKSESSSNTLRQRIVPTTQSPEPLNTGTPSSMDKAENSAEEKECPIRDKTGRSGGNIPPQTVRLSSHKTTGVVIMVIVLVISTYYREPIGDSMRSTCTRIVDIIRDSFQSTPQEDMYISSHSSVSSQEPLSTPSPINETDLNPKEKEHPIDDKTDIDEESLKTSQPQTEAKTSSTPTLTESGIPRPSNAPPGEGKDEGTSKIPLEKSPTDDELVKVLDINPLWFELVVALGVPITQAEAYRRENPPPIASLHALRYWRDGRCDEAKFPPTWKFLLETVDTICGSQVAKRLEAIVSPVQTQQVGPHGGESKQRVDVTV